MSGEDGMEGWSVPARPPFLVAIALLVALAIGLLIGGTVYLVQMAPSTRPPAASFPAPRLETVRSSPGQLREPPVPVPPAGIARAMAETARGGDALWGSARP